MQTIDTETGCIADNRYIDRDVLQTNYRQGCIADSRYIDRVYCGHIYIHRGVLQTIATETGCIADNSYRDRLYCKQ